MKSGIFKIYIAIYSPIYWTINEYHDDKTKQTTMMPNFCHLENQQSTNHPIHGPFAETNENWVEPDLEDKADFVLLFIYLFILANGCLLGQ